MGQLKEIKGYYPYAINEIGLVYNTKTGKWLKPYVQRSGYVSYHIKGGHVYAHRLVAIAYLTDPPQDGLKYEIDHIDCNKENNNYTNLHWVTHSNNIRNALQLKGNWLTGMKKGTKFSTSHKKKLSEAHKQKVGLYVDGILVKVCNSVQDTANYLGVTRTYVYCHMKSKHKLRGYVLIKQ